MNFYPFHIGDFKKHTSHLSDPEELAYRRMLDLYYITEQPLPLDLKTVARKIRMRDEIQIVSDVLSEFFLKSENGYVNNRCEEEITTYTEKADRARKANKARWNAKSDITSDLKSDLISDTDQIPTNPNPNPNPNKSFSPKKKRTGWPKNFELTEERKTKAEAFWKKHGVSFDVQLKWDGFRSNHLSKGSMFKDWDDAWETWYVKAVEFASNGNGNGTVKPQPSGCVKRVQLEGAFKIENCGKPTAGNYHGKPLCQEHLEEMQAKA